MKAHPQGGGPSPKPDQLDDQPTRSTATTWMHPAPGARPGELIAAGPLGYRWVAYQTDGVIVAACYLRHRLVRRDLQGWWYAGPKGIRCLLPDRVVAQLVGSAPDGWPVLEEQAPLLGADALRGEVAS